MLVTFGSVGLPNGMPVAIQRRMRAYSSDSGSSRLPPPWATCPVALSKSRLCSGAAGTRRRLAPVTKAVKSISGSKPSSEFETVLPLAYRGSLRCATQFVKIRTIWLSELMGRCRSARGHCGARQNQRSGCTREESSIASHQVSSCGLAGGDGEITGGNDIFAEDRGKCKGNRHWWRVEGESGIGRMVLAHKPSCEL